MKKILTVIMVSVLAGFTATAQEASVKGTIKGLDKNGTLLELCSVQGGRALPVDTATLSQKGDYTFRFQTEEMAMHLLRLHTGSEIPTIQFIASSGSKLTIDVIYHRDNNFAEIENVKGSAEMEVMKSFNNIIYNNMVEGMRLEEEFTKAGTSESRKRELSNDFARLQQKQEDDIQRLIVSNTDKIMSAFIVTIYDKEASDHIELYEAIEKALTPRYADNAFVKHVSDIVRTTIGPGREAPDIALPDTAGKIRKLSDLRGKVVLLDFWASWCRPCRMENPNVVKLYQAYHDKGFEIYSVSLDQKREDWLRAISTDGLMWPNHVSDLKGWSSQGGAIYGIKSIPATVLIDRNGRVVARNLRGKELSAKVHELLEK